MSKKKVKKPKFTLKGLLHRVKRLSLKADVVIDGEIERDYIVGWVDVRGSQDPVYISESAKHLAKYQLEISSAADLEDDEEAAEEVKKATAKFTAATVACAIQDWDEEFFGQKFDEDFALEIFQQKENFLIYNQIAKYMQEAVDFLPSASQ